MKKLRWRKTQKRGGINVHIYTPYTHHSIPPYYAHTHNLLNTQHTAAHPTNPARTPAKTPYKYKNKIKSNKTDGGGEGE